MANSRKFDLSDILSVTTGVLVSNRGMGGLRDILDFMTGQDLDELQIGSAIKLCKSAILAKYPLLGEVSVPQFGKRNVRKDSLASFLNAREGAAWIAKQKELFGSELTIEALA